MVEGQGVAKGGGVNPRREHEAQRERRLGECKEVYCNAGLAAGDVVR